MGEKPNAGSDDENYDSDEMAEIRAIGKMMLRKKTRTEIIDGTYNKFANHDDADIMPEWFKEDEKKHYQAPTFLTKEQV